MRKTMMRLDLVDVFSSDPLSGNPLAVVHGGDALSDAEMLRLTRWLGYSETAFLLAPSDPGADYRVRIFYPAGELPFAGHPTLGSAFAWAAAGGEARRTGRIIQQCGIGLVEVREMQGGSLAFLAPALQRSGPLEPAELSAALALTGAKESDVVAGVHADNGPGWKLLHLASARAVLAAEPAARAPVPSDVALLGPCGADDEADWEVRAFFANAEGRLVEDPVTGSLNAAVAQYLFAAGLAKDSYRAAQGRKTGANGLVHCTCDEEGNVWVAGQVRAVALGAELPRW